MRNEKFIKLIGIGMLVTVVMTGCGKTKADSAAEIQNDESEYGESEEESESLDSETLETDLPDDDSDMNHTDEDSYEDDSQNESMQNGTENHKIKSGTSNNNIPFSKDSDFIDKVENDPALIDLYYQFKSNNTKAEMDDQYCSNTYEEDGPMGNDSFGIEDLKKYVEKNYFEEKGIEEVSYTLSYSYIDCGADGIPEMAIKFDNLNLYCEDDGSFVVFIFKQAEQKLFLTYSFESWPRCDTSMDWYGHIWSGGSAGAGDNYVDEGILDADGRFHMLNSEEQLTGWWVNYVNEDVYNEIYNTSDYEQNLLTVFCNKIGEEKYYSYILDEGDSTEKELCQNYISACEDNGTSWLTREDIDKKAEEYKESLDLPEVIYRSNDMEIIWEEL